MRRLLRGENKSRRVLARAPSIALLAGLSAAGMLGYAPGCVRSLATPPPGDTMGGPGSSGSGTSNGGMTVVGDGGSGQGSVAAPPALSLAAVYGSTCSSTEPTVSYSPIRRISRVEYDNMVRDLLGDTTQPALGFPPESPMATGVNFQTNTYAGVSALSVQDYQQAAETLAATAVSSQSNLTTLFNLNNVQGCTGTPTDSCAQNFINAFATRAFRGFTDGVLTSGGGSASLIDLYNQVKSQFDVTTGIQAVITAVLESPRFLYVIELGDGSGGGGAVPLSQYEVAGRLAFFLWRSVPDSTLLTAAANNQLSTPAQVQSQAQRMLGVTEQVSGVSRLKAQDALDDFTTQWMQLQSTATVGKDSQYTKWTAKTGEELKDETLTNFSQEALRDGGTLTDLMTTSTSYVNQDLQTFYGASGGTSGQAVQVADPQLSNNPTSFTPVKLSNRYGILTNGAVLATQAHTTLPSSVLRGKLVREQVLCDPIPPPPPNVPPAPTSVPDGGTTRALFEAHEKISGCVTCHQYMDPIGFGFGNYDATGAYQSTDANGFSGTHPAIDSSGQVLPMNDGELSVSSYSGASDLITQLSTSDQVKQCFALQEFRYALGRMESSDDSCSIQKVYNDFASSGANIQKLMLDIVTSDAFLNRSAVSPGGACK